MEPSRKRLTASDHDTLQDIMARMGERIANDPRSLSDPLSAPVSTPSAKVVQLPLWAEEKRGTPNSLLRSALFAAIHGKTRRTMTRELLRAQQGIEIRFTGIQLDQSDLDVFEQAVHLARQYPLGTQCHFTVRGFLKSLHRPMGGDHHNWLKNVLARLSSASIEIKHDRFSYSGTLIQNSFCKESASHHRYILNIDPGLIELYLAGWTAIDWDIRLKLRRRPLALWLHGFYSTHARPYPLKVETLYRLSGSNDKDFYGFKRRLKQALEQLTEVGALIAFELRDHTVFVETIPSPSQARHLIRRETGRVIRDRPPRHPKQKGTSSETDQ